MAHVIWVAEEPSEPTRGWRIYLEADGVNVGYPFGENVFALNKNCSVQIIKDRVWPAGPITPAPRDDPETERFWERF